MNLEKLFQPVRIGLMELKNRIVMAPMGTRFARGGYASAQQRDYYAARAKGGVGLVITEITAVDASLGRSSMLQMAIDDDRFLPDLKALAQAIQQHGAKAAVQLYHAGREAKPESGQPVAPSAVKAPWTITPRELSIAEIEELVDRFAEGAQRAKRAGFDGVEVHGAHHYLVAQFLSPVINLRNDAYGGDATRRARFLSEIVRACKEKAGNDFPVWCRINGAELSVENGLTIDDARIAAQMAQEAGADAVHVSVFGYGADAMANMPNEPGRLVALAEAVKQVVSVPVIAVGGITPDLGENVISSGRADLIAIGRGLLCDPELANKAAEGRTEDIVPCINCYNCINEIIFKKNKLSCTVNPALGREREYILRRAAKPKKVVVVGGGPAGMETARIAALRGHSVTLYEGEDKLGGQLLQAFVAPTKDAIQKLVAYQSVQVEKTGVDVQIGKDATAEDILSRRADAVVLATGVKPIVPDIPGLDNIDVVQAVDVLAGKTFVGEKVLVIGGDLVGCEAADFLADQGKKVIVARRGPKMAVKVMPGLRPALLDRLTRKGVTLMTGVTYEAATSAGMIVIDKDGNRQTLNVDTVVLAAGSEPKTELRDQLEGRGPELFLVGDCLAPRGILEAIHEGSQVGRQI